MDFSVFEMAEEMAQRQRMAEEMAQLHMKRMAEEMAQLRMKRRATRRPESPDSGVSFKSDRSKEDMTNFKGRVSPRLMDFGSDVSAVKDLNKPLDNQRAEIRARLRIEMEEMNQELSSEVGWKHLEAPVSSCS